MMGEAIISLMISGRAFVEPADLLETLTVLVSAMLTMYRASLSQ